MQLHRFHPKSQQRGFTIVELLIATLVFSVVLVLVTMGILQVTRVYYKGVTESNTQNAARNIMDTIAQAIQFNGGIVTETTDTPTAGTSYAFCVGNEQFSYMLGYQLSDTLPLLANQTQHALVVASAVAGCSGAPAQNLAGGAINGHELLSPHMRLANLEVNNVGTNLYEIHVTVAYGDDDLLNNPTDPAASCRGITAGTQFCSVSDLTTTVLKRVQ